jgi:HPt (histidine-containing phosphotransfer) domain-containing protein
MNLRIPTQHDSHATLPDAGATVDLHVLFSVPGMRENRAGLRTRVPAPWRNEASAIIDALRDPAAAGDTHALRLAAHRLKSSSGALGAIHTSSLASSTENAARDGRTARDGQMALRLGKAVQQTLAVFGTLDDAATSGVAASPGDPEVRT